LSAKYIFVVAVLCNEAVMLSWRIERESKLRQIGQSYYVEWGMTDSIRNSDGTSENLPCPQDK
jgi:hypothetical protein